MRDRGALALLLLPLVLIACAPESPESPSEKVLTTNFRGRCMGTTWSVVLRAEDVDDEDAVREAIERALEEVEQEMSHYREDSAISKFNRSREATWFPVSPAFVDNVLSAQQAFRDTKGAFDVTCAPLIDLWGFGPNSPLERKVPTEAEIAAARKHVGMESVEIRREPPGIKKRVPELELNLSAVAKGHGVDRVKGVFVARGITNWLIEVGGELIVVGSKAPGVPWSVAIESPTPQGGIDHVVLEMKKDLAVATSGDYRTRWDEGGKRYSHIIDARTGRPISHATTAATVFHGSSCRQADTYATACLIIGAEEGIRLAESLSLAARFVVRTSPGEYEVRTTRHYRELFGDQ